LVHINRIKPYFYRDDRPEDPDSLVPDVVEQLSQNLAGTPCGEPREEVKAPGKKRPGRPRKVVMTPAVNEAGVPAFVQEPTQKVHVDITTNPVTVPPSLDQGTVHAKISVAEPVVDGAMYDVECILGQREKKGGRKQFLVRWMDRLATDSWVLEADITDDLLEGWWSTHTRRGTLKKRGVHLSMISVPGARAFKRAWNGECEGEFVQIDEMGNEL